LEGARPPETLSYDWPPHDMRRLRPPPPPELKTFVRAMSVLGIPVREIARRVKDRIGVKTYHMRNLYRDFEADLIPRMKRGKMGARRVRLIEKPQGWKPIITGAPFSYADVLAIIQSDLDSRDLARLYGTTDKLIYSMRRGDSKYTQYLLPRIMITKERVSPKDMAWRARVTADMAVKLVTQMRNMVDYAFSLIEEGVLSDPMFDAPKGPQWSLTMYRKTESGIEERVLNSPMQVKAATLEGWSKEKPNA
jgi:hypothetical protein